MVQVDTPMILAAAEASRQEQLSFWDAVIVRAAVEADCSELFSEDLQDGRKFGSVVVRNPFR